MEALSVWQSGVAAAAAGGLTDTSLSVSREGDPICIVGRHLSRASVVWGHAGHISWSRARFTVSRQSQPSWPPRVILTAAPMLSSRRCCWSLARFLYEHLEHEIYNLRYYFTRQQWLCRWSAFIEVHREFEKPNQYSSRYSQLDNLFLMNTLVNYPIKFNYYDTVLFFSVRGS